MVSEIEKIITEKYGRLLVLNADLRRIATGCMATGIKMETGRHTVIQLFLGKSYKTHAAILALAKQGYGEDAVILARSLFENYINLKYILSKRDDSLAIRYVAYDAVIQRTMLQDAMGIPSTRKMLLKRKGNAKLGDVNFKEIKKDYEMAMKEYSFDIFGWSGKNTSDLSRLAGRPNDYKTIYSLQCQLSHPSTRGMNDYFTRGSTNPSMNVGPNENYIEHVLVMAHDYFGSILDISGDYLDWKIEERLSQQLDAFSNELKIINENSELHGK